MTPVKAPGTHSIADITESVSDITSEKDNPTHSTPFTPGESIYLPPNEVSSSEVGFDLRIPQRKPLNALNEYLVSRDVSPWAKASLRNQALLHTES